MAVSSHTQYTLIQVPSTVECGGTGSLGMVVGSQSAMRSDASLPARACTLLSCVRRVQLMLAPPWVENPRSSRYLAVFGSIWAISGRFWVCPWRDPQVRVLSQRQHPFLERAGCLGSPSAPVLDVAIDC